MTVGDRIRSAREAKGMTQLELAKKIGYTTTGAMSLIESGKRDLALDKVREIAKVLDVTPNWLMGWADSPVLIKTDQEITAEMLKDLTSAQLEEVRLFIRFLQYEGKK